MKGNEYGRNATMSTTGWCQRTMFTQISRILFNVEEVQQERHIAAIKCGKRMVHDANIVITYIFLSKQVKAISLYHSPFKRHRAKFKCNKHADQVPEGASWRCEFWLFVCCSQKIQRKFRPTTSRLLSKTTLFCFIHWVWSQKNAQKAATCAVSDDDGGTSVGWSCHARTFQFRIVFVVSYTKLFPGWGYFCCIRSVCFVFIFMINVIHVVNAKFRIKAVSCSSN